MRKSVCPKTYKHNLLMALVFLGYTQVKLILSIVKGAKGLHCLQGWMCLVGAQSAMAVAAVVSS